MIRLGILELGEGMANVSHEGILEHTIECATLAEANNYTKFWLSEHHEQNNAWRSPEILVAIIAGYTDKINVGAGGMLLPINSPLRIAQSFKMLATLFPGRIDLGIGKGIPASDYIAQQLLNGISCKEMIAGHDERIKSTLQFLQDYTIGPENKVIETSPVSGKLPNPWILATSGSAADVLIKAKCAFSFSLFHKSKLSINERAQLFRDITKRYEDTNGEKLTRNIAVSIRSGESPSEIEKRERGGFDITISGTPASAVEQIRELAGKFDVDEVLVYYASDSIQNRLFCIEAFANEIAAAKK